MTSSNQLDVQSLVYDLIGVADAQIDPAGSRIAYVRSAPDDTGGQATSSIWLTTIDGLHERQLTRTGNANFGPRWSPDGSRLASISNRGEGYGVYDLRFDGGDPIPLFTHDMAIGPVAWSPDGTTVAIAAEFDPDASDEEQSRCTHRVTRRADYKQDGRGYLGDRRAHIWLVDVDTGDTRRLTGPPDEHVHASWSPDSKTIASIVPSWNFHASQMALVNVETGDETRIGDPGGAIGSFAWSPDASSIVFAGDPERTWQFDFFLFDVATGEIRQLTHDLPCSPLQSWSIYAPASPPVWLDDCSVEFLAATRGMTGLYRLDTAEGTVDEIERWPFQSPGWNSDRQNHFVVQATTSFESFGEIVVYDRQSATNRTISGINSGTHDEHHPAQWERVLVSRDEQEIESWLLKPADFSDDRSYPPILNVHGGPNGWHGHSFNRFEQVLTGAGFLVLSVNPRGSGSYGREFLQLVTGDWAGGDYEDQLFVLDHVCERPYVDESKCGIFGYSYGGYMTAWTISQTDQFRAAVCGAPIFDLESFYGTSDIGPYWGPIQWGGTPADIQEWCQARSPSTFAHRAKTPTLIVHGEADDRCPIGQGEQMYAILNASGCEVEFVRYPDESHFFPHFGQPANIADFLQRTVSWFTTHIE